MAVIIQGEGKGHFSQAMEAIRLLREQGDEVTGCYLGRSLFRKMPDYFRKSSPLPLKTFLGPNFLRTPDRKGIHIFFSLLLNTLLIPIYFFEALRLGIMLRRDGSEQLLNFYDPVGALAGKWTKRGSRKIMISHHFYLSHPDFIHPHGMERAFFWLQLMNAIMMRQADEVYALSFRKGSTHGRIRVVPPLVSEKLRKAREKIPAGIHNPADRDSGAENQDPMAKVRDPIAKFSDPVAKDSDPIVKVSDPDLCYFLNPGFVQDMLKYYRERPWLKADLFTDDPGPVEPSVNVKIRPPDREAFLSAMQHAGRIICTAGFDTVAEAFFLGLPVFVIPPENHYEQYCNALDAVRTGMAYQLESLAELDEAEFDPRDNTTFVKWLETGHDKIFRGGM